MAAERRTTGLWTVHFDPELPSNEALKYNNVVNELVDIPMAPRYKVMSARPLACFQAVQIWRQLGSLLPGVNFDDQWVGFDRPVTDAYGFQETGQDMLKIQVPHTTNMLVADVAGYLFGFPYEEMLVVAGSAEYISQQASIHYSKKYQDLTVNVIK